MPSLEGLPKPITVSKLSNVVSAVRPNSLSGCKLSSALHIQDSISLTVAHINIRSLRPKLLDLEVNLDYKPADVLCLSEHFLYGEEMSLYVPDGFVPAASFCRKPPLIRGGSAIYVKSHFKFEVIDLSLFESNFICEICAIRLIDFNFIIISLYRTPDSECSQFLAILKNVLAFISGKSFDYIAVAGDFNIDILKTNKCDTQDFLNIVRSFDLYCTNFEPTHDLSCIDNILTNISNQKFNSSLLGQHVLSDHAGVWVSFYDLVRTSQKCNSNRVRPITYQRRLTSISRLDNFKMCLSNVDWSFMYGSLDVDVIFDVFLNVLFSCFESSCPLINVRSKTNRAKGGRNSWFTPHLQNMRTIMLSMYDRWKLTKTLEDKIRFKNFKNMYVKAVKDAKVAFNDCLLNSSKNKCKAAWDLVRKESNLCKVKQDFVGSISPENFNSFFVNVASSVNAPVCNVTNVSSPLVLLDKFSTPRPESSGKINFFTWKSVTEGSVLGIVSQMSSSRAIDVYGLSNQIVKHVIDVIVGPLTYIINLMFLQGVFPDSLKLTKITPIFKKGNKDQPECYRPIAVVPIISKVIESCMFIQLYEYFSSNDLLYLHQYGFRPKHSTGMAVESIVEYILNCFEHKLNVGACLIDLCKAFDCISHTILCDKLEFYGVSNAELSLIRSYLNNRKQKVVVNNCSSEYLNVISGVPQGSVLGPFLFLVYVNDLYCNVPAFSVLYADDTTFLCSNRDFSVAQELLQISVNESKQWFSSNELVVNEDKTEFIYFSLSDRSLNDDASHVKLLGIYLDDNLSWETHISYVIKRLSRVIFLMRKLKTCVSTEVLITVYYGLFHSVIMYGLRLWGYAPQSSKIFIWQKKALRIIDGLAPRESCKPSFYNHQILTLPSMYILSNLVYVRENIANFDKQSNSHSHDTRCRDNLTTPHIRLTKTFKSHYFQQIKLFNKLPQNVRTLSQSSFKKTVSKWLKQRVFYSIEEYINFDFTCGPILF